MKKYIIEKSSHIEVIVEVTQINDAYSAYANISISDMVVLIEFASAVDYKVGERILISGSLELMRVDGE